MDNTDDLNYTAEQCLHSIKTFSVSHIVPTRGRDGDAQEVGRKHRTADLNCAKGYSIPYGVMLSI